MGYGALVLTERPNPLVMQGVDFDSLVSEKGCEAAPGFELDGMSGVGGKSVFMGFGALTREMGLELAAAGSNHELHSVTNGQDGESSRVGRREKGLIERQLFGRDQIELNAAGKRSLRREIVAPRQEQPIEASDDLSRIFLDRQMQRQSACAAHGIGVAAIDIMVLAVGSPAFAVVERERDPDSGLSHGTSIAICGMLAGWHKW